MSLTESGQRSRVVLDSAAAVYERKSAEEIQRLSGRPSLLEAGLEKVRGGATTLEELLRVVSL